MDISGSTARILVTAEPAPPEDTEAPVTAEEWKRIREIFADELKDLRKSLPVRNRLFSGIRIEPVKYSEGREVLLLRTSVEERNGNYKGGAAILDLESGEYFYRESSLFHFRDPQILTGNLARNILDVNRAGWQLLVGDRENLFLYDTAEKKTKTLPAAGSFSFGAFLEDDRYILCRQGNILFLFSSVTGLLCDRKEFPEGVGRIYLTGGNTFALVQENTAVLCIAEADFPEGK